MRANTQSAIELNKASCVPKLVAVTLSVCAHACKAFLEGIFSVCGAAIFREEEQSHHISKVENNKEVM